MTLFTVYDIELLQHNILSIGLTVLFYYSIIGNTLY